MWQEHKSSFLLYICQKLHRDPLQMVMRYESLEVVFDTVFDTRIYYSKQNSF